MFEKFPLILLKSKIKIKKNRRDCEVLLGRGANSNFCQVLVPVPVPVLEGFEYSTVRGATDCTTEKPSVH